MRSEDFAGDPASSRAFPGWETVTVDGKDYLVPPEDDPVWRKWFVSLAMAKGLTA